MVTLVDILKGENMNKFFEKNKNIIFIVVCIFAMIIMYLHYAGYRIDEENFKVLLTNYSDGFVSAGFIGSLYSFLNSIFSIDLYNYEMMYFFSKHMLFVYYIISVVLLSIIFVKCKKENKNTLMTFITISIIIIGSMFGAPETMGTYMMYETILLFLCMIFFVISKIEWINILFVTVAVLINPEFLFRGFLLVAAMFLYKISKENKKNYYYTLLIISTVITVVLFIVQNVISIFNGTFEIRVYDSAYFEIIVFMILISPYLYIGRSFFTNVFSFEKSRVYRLLQLIPIISIIEIVLKNDFGYIFYGIIVYYLFAMMYMILENDNIVLFSLEKTKMIIRERCSFSYILIAYPLLIMPFSNYFITRITRAVLSLIGV